MKKSYVYLLTTFMLWGSLYVVSQFVLGKIPTFTVAMFRYLIAFIALSLISLKSEKEKIENAWELCLKWKKNRFYHIIGVNQYVSRYRYKYVHKYVNQSIRMYSVSCSFHYVVIPFILCSPIYLLFHAFLIIIESIAFKTPLFDGGEVFVLFTK